MKLADIMSNFTAFKSSTTKALEDHKAALAERDNKISALTEMVEALQGAAKAKADEDAADEQEDTEEDSTLDKIIEFIQSLKSDESEDSDDSTDGDSDDSDSDSEDDSSDDNDSSDETAKATKVEKIKAISGAVKKLAGDIKAAKAAAQDEVIKTYAAIGIPTPVATKLDGQKANLTPRERVAAAFEEQLHTK